jgi:putative restriction endonuclease
LWCSRTPISLTRENARRRMSIRLIVAVTDRDWFNHLRQIPNLSEANFWSPSASTFRALQPGELFLFKLHSPDHFIVGGGIFTHANLMPCSLAWEAFGESNGAASLTQMRARIARYRRVEPNERDDFVIGCRILSQPFFFDRSRWLPIPKSFALTTVTFKTYSTDDLEGRQLWDAVQDRSVASEMSEPAQAPYGQPLEARYGELTPFIAAKFESVGINVEACVSICIDVDKIELGLI